MTIVFRSLALTTALTLGLGACTLKPEPLRAGWLASGVYPQPPAPACAPIRAPGRPYDELSRWTPPSLDARVDVQLSLPWTGAFAVRAAAPGSAGPRHRLAQTAATPLRVVEDRMLMAQVPGFVGGVDLRGFRRIAFIADTSGWMCDFAKCPDGETSNNLPPPLLQIIGDQIDAAVAGMRPDQVFTVYAGGAWREIRFAPTSTAGRALAGQFVRGQVCSGARGIRGQLGRAIGDAPDVVVVLTDGQIQFRRHNDYERRYEECDVAPNYLYCYVDEVSERVDLARLTNGKRIPPVIAVSVARHEARWLQNLAEATGGAYVDVAP